MRKFVITENIAVLLILLFAYSATSKLVEFAQFRTDLEMQALPSWTTPILLYSLPGIEISAAVLLAVPVVRLIGFYLSVLLMLLFTGYVGLVILHAFSSFSCSCGGVIKTLGWKNHLFFNLFFLVSAATGLILQIKERRFSGKVK